MGGTGVSEEQAVTLKMSIDAMMNRAFFIPASPCHSNRQDS